MPNLSKCVIKVNIIKGRRQPHDVMFEKYRIYCLINGGAASIKVKQYMSLIACIEARE